MIRKKIFSIFAFMFIFMLFTACDNNLTSSNPNQTPPVKVINTNEGIEIKGNEITQLEFIHFKKIFNMIINGASLQSITILIENQLSLTNSAKYENTLQFILNNKYLVKDKDNFNRFDCFYSNIYRFIY